MEEGGVGIVFHTSRGGRVLVVKSLVAGGAAERSCAVEVGHQIIAVGDQDVTSATLEEVAGLLRGVVNSQVQLRFLETRDVRLVVERTFADRNGDATVGIKWKSAVGEYIVEGTLEEYSGFGGSPKPGDRLLRIDGESIDDMRDDEVRRKLAGDADSSVRLDFARGVAQHSVTLTRQPLALAAITGKSIKSASDALRGSIDGSSNYVTSLQNENSTALAPLVPIPDSPAFPGHQANGSLPSTAYAEPEGQSSIAVASELPNTVPAKKQEDSVNQQLVDIVRRLKQELETSQQEVVNLKATHRKELQELQAASGTSAESEHELVKIKDLLLRAEQQLERAEQELISRDTELTSVKTELNGVKSVLTRRAEAIGDSKKKVDEIEVALVQANAANDALKGRCQHLETAYEEAQRSIQELKSTRELDDRNLRAAADAALKWQIQEVEKQAGQTKADLQAKTEEAARANETIKIQAQSMMSWQAAQETTQTKLSAAVEELNRLRKTNEELEATVRQGEEDAEQQRTRHEHIESELANVQKEAGSIEERSTKVLQEREAEWEQRAAEVEEVWKRKHAATLTQIASMQDQLDVGEAERARMEEAAGQAQQARKEAAKEKDEMQTTIRELEAKVVTAEAEVEETKTKLEQALGRAEKLTDASHSWRDQLVAAQEQLASAQKTIEAQAKACLQESNRREEAEERLERQDEEAERQRQELTGLAGAAAELREVKGQHEAAKERLKSFDQLQLQLQNDARQRMQFMQRVSGNVPYQQLVAMLQDSNSSVASLQGVVQAKDRQIGTIQQQLTELSNVREMTVDAERQLMKLKEALDWKTITLQQMTAVLSSCQTAMQKHGMAIPDELLEQLSDVLALQNSQRRQDEDSNSPYAQSPTAAPGPPAVNSSVPNSVSPGPVSQQPAFASQPPPPRAQAGPLLGPGPGNHGPSGNLNHPRDSLNLHSTGPGPGPPSQIPMHSSMGHGQVASLHTSLGPGVQVGGPGPQAVHHGPGSFGALAGPAGSRMAPNQGFQVAPGQAPPTGMVGGPAVATYPGQRDSDFAMAM